MIPKPNTFIVGSSKCGTTTLSEILATHPDCCVSRPKEPEFFNLDENFDKGWEWYSSCWKHYAGERIIAEATPRYTRRDLYPKVVERLAGFSSESKIIHISRDPYEKFVSFWRMSARMKASRSEEYPEICDFFRTDPRMPELLKSCMYEYQLVPFFDSFPKNQIHLMTAEDLNVSPKREIQELFEFLNIDGSNAGEYTEIRANTANSQKTSGFRQFVSSVVRSRVRREQARVDVARQDLDPKLRAEFIGVVRDDALAHLDRLEKPPTFWNLEL